MVVEAPAIRQIREWVGEGKVPESVSQGFHLHPVATQPLEHGGEEVGEEDERKGDQADLERPRDRLTAIRQDAEGAEVAASHEGVEGEDLLEREPTGA